MVRREREGESMKTWTFERWRLDYLAAHKNSEESELVTLIEHSAVAEAVAAERAAQREATETTVDEWGFNTLVWVVRRLLLKYPAETFDGSSGDSGPMLIVGLRKAIEDFDALQKNEYPTHIRHAAQTFLDGLKKLREAAKIDALSARLAEAVRLLAEIDEGFGWDLPQWMHEKVEALLAREKETEKP
jgi:hypothetical protein